MTISNVRHRLAATAAATLLLAALPGQDARWDIPHRGAHVYERQTRRFELTAPPTDLATECAIANGSAAEPHRWRYHTCAIDKVPAGFHKKAFDDSGWPVGAGGFGPTGQKDGPYHTEWKSAVICTRTTFDVGSRRPKALWFRVDHDDGVRIWLNGELVADNERVGRDHPYVVIGTPLRAWRRGENVVAVQCTNTGGAQYLDVRLDVFRSLPRGVKTEQDLQQALREETEAVNRVQRALFGAFRPPAMLLQGELDEDGRRVLRNPVDLREIAWFVAMDLRCGTRGGAVRIDSRRMWELGDIEIRGTASAVDGSGWQTVEVRVETTPEMAVGKGDRRQTTDAQKRFVHHGFDGMLTVRRRFETAPAGLRVVAFETDLQGTVTRGENFRQPACGLVQQEHFKLIRTHQNRDAPFRLLVKERMDKGVAKLREALEKAKTDNSLKPDKEGSDRSYHSGRLAIALLAVMKGGLPKDDEVLVAALDELRGRTLVDTYSLGNAMMVLESYHQPSTEADQLTGQIDRPTPRKIPADDFALMEKWVDRLLQNIDTRVDPDRLLRFNYVEGGRYDNSLQQYGLLGLYSAHLCGVDISPTVWEAAAYHLLDVQADDGERFQLELIDYRTHNRMLFNPEEPITASRSIRRTNGWSYYGAESNGAESGVWGSMTCAGITGLAICQAGLLDDDRNKYMRLQGSCDEARLDGFAWLARNLTVRHHPGALTRQRRWLYYYLYGLERAALLSGIALIQDRDWYFEAALMLSLVQNEDGNWPSELNGDEQIERNAMAILLMKRGTTPVLTGR